MAKSSPKFPIAALWVIWAFVAFVAMNVYSRPATSETAAERPSFGIGALLALLRDDGDTRRYFAYASAMLGRPYDPFYVHAVADSAPARDHGIVAPERALVPWRDFPVEYPPGVLLAATPPALIAGDFPTFHFLFSLEMELLLTAAVWLGVRTAERMQPGSGRETLKLSIVFLAALGVIGARRYDALVALAISAAAYGLAARRPQGAGFAFAVSVVAKGAPALLAPIGAHHLWRSGSRAALARAAIAGGLTLAVGVAGYVAFAGGHALDALAYHADRPIQIESPYGAALMIVHLFRRDLVEMQGGFGSHNIVASFEPYVRVFATAATGLTIAAVYIVYAWGAARLDDDAARLRLALAAASAVLIAFIGLGKVFSPQYLTWLLPLAVIVAAQSSERSRVLLIAAVAAAQVEYPFLYETAFAYPGPILGAAALIRDALLLAAGAALMSEALRRTKR